MPKMANGEANMPKTTDVAVEVVANQLVAPAKGENIVRSRHNTI